MPFTPSHAAAVLPVLGRRSARVVPVAWVAGSMAPDYPWFLTGGRGAGLTHTVLGIVTVDLLVGLVAVLAWRTVVLGALRDLLPLGVGTRLPVPVAVAPRQWVWAAVGVVGGAATHVLWDAFTHAGRWGTRWVPLLHSRVGVLPGYKWAQYGSGVVGGVLVLLALGRAARRAVPRAAEPARVDARQRALLAAVLVLLVSVVLVLVALDRRGGTPEVLLFGLVTRGGAAAGVGVLLACVGWWLLPVRTRAPDLLG
ncbi:DUF4184 family protein [Phycicoccus avicenniae]|uniref:DUF4184 family protein n=1 Tax=Phycicoccus avicenniae TaxID=2828860 RepID=UPI003D2D284D